MVLCIANEAVLGLVTLSAGGIRNQSIHRSIWLWWWWWSRHKMPRSRRRKPFFMEGLQASVRRQTIACQFSLKSISHTIICICMCVISTRGKYLFQIQNHILLEEARKRRIISHHAEWKIVCKQTHLWQKMVQSRELGKFNARGLFLIDVSSEFLCWKIASSSAHFVSCRLYVHAAGV